MAQLFNLDIQSPNSDYSFILSPFSLHHSFTSTDFCHSPSHMFHSFFSPSPDCASNKDISKMATYTSRTFPPT